MSIDRTTLIKLTQELMNKPLQALGYEFNEDRFDFEHWCYGFYKKSESLNLYLYLHFQPTGFTTNELFDLYINLIRTNVADIHEIETEWVEPVEKIWARMDHSLFGITERPKWQWHFLNEEEARFELNDVLEKIIQFGIPFLEDPKSNIDNLFKN